MFQFGEVFGGLSPQKPPVATGLPGGQAFPSEIHLNEFTNHIHLVKMI